MTIHYHKRSVYGIEKLYITDAATAERVSRLTGRKTIEPRDIENLAALGVELIHQPIN